MSYVLVQDVCAGLYAGQGYASDVEQGFAGAVL